MPKSVYEVTQRIVTDNDGLVSVTIIKTKEIVATPEEDDNEDDNTGTGQ